MSEEKEVFRSIEFDKNKCYGFALYTKKIGGWPNERYYTKNPIQYLGKYIRSERWGGGGDGAQAAEIFNNGNVKYDYDGKTCFVELPCEPNEEIKDQQELPESIYKKQAYEIDPYYKPRYIFKWGKTHKKHINRLSKIMNVINNDAIDVVVDNSKEEEVDLYIDKETKHTIDIIDTDNYIQLSINNTQLDYGSIIDFKSDELELDDFDHTIDEKKDEEKQYTLGKYINPNKKLGGAGKRKTRRNRKSKKGKRSRKARKSRRKSNRRRGRR